MVEFANLIVQILLLGAVLIYVWKTWQMAVATQEMARATKEAAESSLKSVEEMRTTRAEEARPYVIVYFDVVPRLSGVYLVIENIGRTPAHIVELQFSPPLSFKAKKLPDLWAASSGISFLAPRQEIRSLYETTLEMFNDPGEDLKWEVSVSYLGAAHGVEFKENQVLDLNQYRGLMWLEEKGLPGIAKELEGIRKGIDNIHRDLQSGSESLCESIDRLAPEEDSVGHSVTADAG